MRNYLYIFLFLLIGKSIYSQELNCQVSVVSVQVQGTTEKQIFDQLQKSIFEFMNNTRWTKDNFTVNERIDCSVLINVTQKLSADDYMATIQIQSRRPVFKSSYFSPTVNYIDESFVFKYQQFQQLEFNLNTFQNNITSVLAYYAYIIIANDYDTYSNLGGTEYFQKAQLIVTNAQSAAESGWKSFESQKNRYWIVENALQPVFQPIRECMYKYHRLGLDIMYDKPDDGRKEILKSMDLLTGVYKNRPASFAMELFFDAKVTEVVNIFSKGQPDEKSKAVEILTTVDPANSNKYFKIQEN
ncbi:MAG: DUF4835 family protein [Bacteroidetes bacterium]|jgi:hypothetical protein|nr:DUF4835 family protein [Bacteroidota bacterium]